MNYLKEKIDPLLRHSFVRFCVVGGLGTLSNLFVFSCAISILGTGINTSSVLAFMFAVTQNYFLNGTWSFRSTSDTKLGRKNYATYVSVNILSLLINLVVLNILTRIGFSPLISQAAGIVAGIGGTYFGARYIVFTKKQK